ncbi:MAG: hypothetical protein ABSA96_03130 [Candidatus Acidiferrales bacterium]
MPSSASLLLALVFVAGIFEVETCAPPRAVSLLRASFDTSGGEQAGMSRNKSAAAGTNRAAARLGNHYLMLVNSAVASQMDGQKLAQFDRSPYDGLAVSFEDAYDTSPVESAAAMEAQIAVWKKNTTKDIWPWVYLNRMVGGKDAEANEYAKVPYFQRIQGVDLDDSAGAQKDFLQNWRNALRVAKDTGVAGIVCDLEFYNNYKAYDLGELSRLRGQPPSELVKLLKQVGARMADAGAAEYPGATLWFLFTGFTRPDYRVVDGQPTYFAATYVVEGLLDRIEQRHLPLHVVTGGSVGLGYCHTSVDDLSQAIQKRASTFAPLLQEHGGILELAGTMTLWNDRSAKRTWVAQGACGASTANTIEDLEPYMELLFRSYRYNWIYGSPNGGYLAFQADTAPRFNAAISRAKTLALGERSQ